MHILERDVLNAFCRHTHVACDGAESGPLHGLTFGLKDIFDVADHRTGFGNPDWYRTHDAASETASVVTRLLQAGASLAGKTHTEEMAFSLTGENAHYGTPMNPRAPGRVPGGSSSGSAAAVAGGLVDFAIGSDTGGSVRAPASYCGIFGMRPTHGRITLDGVLPLAPMFDTCGWFARDAALLARVGAVLLADTSTAESTSAGARMRGPVRLLIASDAFATAHQQTVGALMPAVQRAESLFGTAANIVVSETGLRDWFTVFRALQHDAIWQTHGAWITAVRPAFGPQIAARFDVVSRTDVEEVIRMRQRHISIRERLDALLSDDAVLLMPTVPDIAPLLQEPSETAVPERERALSLLCVAGLGGLPQVSLPVGMVRGCPVGLSLLAARGNDELLLDVVQQLSDRASD